MASRVKEELEEMMELEELERGKLRMEEETSVKRVEEEGGQPGQEGGQRGTGGGSQQEGFTVDCKVEVQADIHDAPQPAADLKTSSAKARITSDERAVMEAAAWLGK